MFDVTKIDKEYEEIISKMTDTEIKQEWDKVCSVFNGKESLSKIEDCYEHVKTSSGVTIKKKGGEEDGGKKVRYWSGVSGMV